MAGQTWPNRFLRFFKEVEPTLGVVLNANGCREGWLQGEFYRSFWTQENGFQVNCSCAEPKIKHDLYCKQPTEMLAEIKIYGQNGYESKNLYGYRKIHQFVPDTSQERRYLLPKEINELSPYPGSYLADVFRLQNAPMNLERYMILVLQKNDQIDHFGRAILAVQICPTEKEYQFECEQFLVRISAL